MVLELERFCSFEDVISIAQDVKTRAHGTLMMETKRIDCLANLLNKNVIDKR